MNVVGVILAGGRSARMGGTTKAMLPLDGMALIEHVLRRLRPQVETVVVNANANPTAFAHYDLPVIPDGSFKFAGPLAGILAGMEFAAARGIELIATVAVDTPFFPANLVSELDRARRQAAANIAMASTRPTGEQTNRHPTFALWPISLRNNLLTALGQGVRKVTDWADTNSCVTVEFPVLGDDPFFNINTPQDLIRAQAICDRRNR